MLTRQPSRRPTTQTGSAARLGTIVSKPRCSRKATSSSVGSSEVAACECSRMRAFAVRLAPRTSAKARLAVARRISTDPMQADAEDQGDGQPGGDGAPHRPVDQLVVLRIEAD